MTSPQTSDEEEPALAESDEELELSEKAKQSLETLQLMLGSSEIKNAAKLFQMIKKKIKYMINDDLDVAKDFLDLVEVLKHHKAVNKALMKQSQEEATMTVG